MPYANKKGADQPAHLHNLISTFVVCCIDNITHIVVIQGSPFIMLCLGSIELDRVISEPCYKGIIL